MKKKFFIRPAKDWLALCLFTAVSTLLVFAIIRSYRHFKESPPYVDPVKYPIRGIDVSAHNGDIDFHKVANDGIDFVFIKATEGTDFNDKNFIKNFTAAHEAGLKRGVYHFFRFDSDGVEQANNFLRTIGSRKPELGYVIDVEASGNHDSIPLETVKGRLYSMVDYMNLLGFRVMFYTNFDGYYNYIADTFPGYPLWICRFQKDPINTEWTFWQYDHHGVVDGIIGDVDLNAFCGNRDEWESFLNGAIWPYAS